MASGTIKGIVVEIGGDTGPLEKALQGVNKTSRDLQSELTQVNKLLKLDPTNVDLLNQKQKLLAESVSTTKGKLDTLKEAERQAQEQFKQGKVSEEQYRALQREVVKTEQNLKGLETQAKKANGALTSDQAIGNLKSIGKAVGVTALAVGAGFAAMGVAELENADKIQVTADIYGLTAERVQELQYVGTKLDVDLDTMTKAQSLLTKNMYLAEKGTGAQADAFKALGVSAVDGNGNLRDAKTVMDETITALGKMPNETERDAVAMKLFGKSAMELNPLIKAGGEEIAKLTDEAHKTGAVLSNESVAGLDAFGDSAEALKVSIMGLVGQALAKILPQLQGMLANLMAIPAWIDKNSTLLTIIGIVLGTFTIAIVAYNIAVGWAAITTGIMTAATAAFGAVLAFITSPITIVILAIGALILIGVLLYKNWDTVSAFLSSTWNGIAATATNVWNGLKDFFVGLWNGITSTATNAWNGLKNGISNTMSSTVSGGINIFNGILDFFRNLPGTLYNLGVGAFNGLKNGISSILSTLGSAVSSGFNGAISFIKGLPGQAVQWGKDFIQGLINGITSMIGGIGRAVSGVGNTIRGFLHFSTPDIGPLADYEKWMPDFMGGLAKGIENSKYLVANAVKGLSTDINLGMRVTPAMAGSIGNSTSQTVKQGDTNINFNGNYSFAGQKDIDYFMNKAAVLVQRRQG